MYFTVWGMQSSFENTNTPTPPPPSLVVNKLSLSHRHTHQGSNMDTTSVSDLWRVSRNKGDVRNTTESSGVIYISPPFFLFFISFSYKSEQDVYTVETTESFPSPVSQRQVTKHKSNKTHWVWIHRLPLNGKKERQKRSHSQKLHH